MPWKSPSPPCAQIHLVIAFVTAFVIAFVIPIVIAFVIQTLDQINITITSTWTSAEPWRVRGVKWLPRVRHWICGGVKPHRMEKSMCFFPFCAASVSGLQLGIALRNAAWKLWKVLQSHFPLSTAIVKHLLPTFISFHEILSIRALQLKVLFHFADDCSVALRA